MLVGLIHTCFRFLSREVAVLCVSNFSNLDSYEHHGRQWSQIDYTDSPDIDSFT